MERSLHCPSPIINGRITTVVESKHNKGHMAPPGKKSLFSTESTQSDTLEESDDPDQVSDDEVSTLGDQVDRLKNDFKKLATIGNTSANSSVNNSPVMKARPLDKTNISKARNIQGNLLSLIKTTENSGGLRVTSYYNEDDSKNKEKKERVAAVRSNLKVGLF